MKVNILQRGKKREEEKESKKRLSPQASLLWTGAFKQNHNPTESHKRKVQRSCLHTLSTNAAWGPLCFALPDTAPSKASRLGQVGETLQSWGCTFTGCIHWWLWHVHKPQACSSILIEIRSSSRPQKVSLMWMGFYWSVTKWGRASPGPRTPSSASLPHTSGQQIYAMGNAAVWCRVSKIQDSGDLRAQEGGELIIPSPTPCPFPCPPSQKPDLLTTHLGKVC